MNLLASTERKLNSKTVNADLHWPPCVLAYDTTAHCLHCCMKCYCSSVVSSDPCFLPLKSDISHVFKKNLTARQKNRIRAVNANWKIRFALLTQPVVCLVPDEYFLLDEHPRRQSWKITVELMFLKPTQSTKHNSWMVIPLVSLISNTNTEWAIFHHFPLFSWVRYGENSHLKFRCMFWATDIAPQMCD